MKGMSKFNNKFWQLAIPDPPYGINAPNMQMGSNPNRSRTDGYGSGPAISTTVKLKGRLNSGSGKNRLLNTSDIDWDNETPTPEYFAELKRVSDNQIIWGGNYFDLGPTRCVVGWDKMQPWENFSQWEMAWTSFDSPASVFKYSNTGGNNLETKIHPTQKPISLYVWLLKRYAKPGYKIIDTHMGSQSLRIAAYKMGFDFWGWEINEQYFIEGNKRFEKAISEPLFNAFNNSIQSTLL